VLSILMPVYNERERVALAIEQVLSVSLPVDLELIVVDDGSTDGTSEILGEGEWNGRVRRYAHEVNMGKGAAIRTALSHARGEYTAIFDADLEYDPADLNLLVAPLLESQANACFGIRAFDGYTSHSFLFVMGNRLLTLVCNVLYNTFLHDIMTCQKMIRTDILRSLTLRSRGFEVEAEITAGLLQRRERIYEVPVHYRARTSREGKKLTARDGVSVLRMLLRCRFSSI
jgi:glycosyltransferase involved in cell wall biosynthesis